MFESTCQCPRNAVTVLYEILLAELHSCGSPSNGTDGRSQCETLLDLPLAKSPFSEIAVREDADR